MKKYKILKYIFVIAISLLLIQCNSDKKKLNRELAKIAAEWNRSTPVVLEAHTRFDSVGVTPDNVFQYYYTITNIENPQKLIASYKNEMLEKMDKIYATDRSLQFFVENRVTMEYIYRDTMQNVVDVITIETDKYRRTKE
jgi:hypothetical protein